jgi:predicted  nucleic acid-binding Zn-ribbon protein
MIPSIERRFTMSFAGLTESLNSALDAAEPEVRDFVKVLQAEIRKLQKENIKLQAQHISSQERIAALEEELKEEQARPIAVIQHFGPPEGERSI